MLKRLTSGLGSPVWRLMENLRPPNMFAWVPVAWRSACSAFQVAGVEGRRKASQQGRSFFFYGRWSLDAEFGEVINEEPARISVYKSSQGVPGGFRRSLAGFLRSDTAATRRWSGESTLGKCTLAESVRTATSSQQPAISNQQLGNHLGPNTIPQNIQR
jgi:hypothetical protein